MKDKGINTNSNLNIWVGPILRGSIVGISVILIIFILIALVLSFGILPLSATPAAACLAIAVGAFFAGLSASKKTGKNGLITGAICGAALFILFTLIGMAAFGSTPGISTLIRLIIFITAGAIGGIIGVGSADKRKII